IRNAAQTVQNVVTYDAVIDVENPELRLKPGMTANVTFVYARRANVLRVPNAALRFHPSPAMLKRLASKRGELNRSATRGVSARDAALRDRAPGLRTVWVLRGTKPKSTQIRTGVTDGTVT